MGGRGEWRRRTVQPRGQRREGLPREQQLPRRSRCGLDGLEGVAVRSAVYALGCEARLSDLADCRVRCIVWGSAMPWLADPDVGAARGFVRGIAEARTVMDLQVQLLRGLADLVPADVLT